MVSFWFGEYLVEFLLLCLFDLLIVACNLWFDTLFCLFVNVYGRHGRSSSLCPAAAFLSFFVVVIMPMMCLCFVLLVFVYWLIVVWFNFVLLTIWVAAFSSCSGRLVIVGSFRRPWFLRPISCFRGTTRIALPYCRPHRLVRRAPK